MCRATTLNYPTVPNLKLILQSIKPDWDKLRLRGYRIESLDLELSPSPESQEKQRILDRICQEDGEAKARLEKMATAEREQLMSAPSMLVLMLQLSEGKPFDLIVADVIRRLPSDEDYPVYQVFGVICSFYQYSINLALIGQSGTSQHKQEAIDLTTNMARCYQAQGHNYSTKGRNLYPQAIKHFQKAIEFDRGIKGEKTGHFWYEFGCFYRDAMQNPTEARTCFENSLNQNINLCACVDLAELEVAYLSKFNKSPRRRTQVCVAANSIRQALMV